MNCLLRRVLYLTVFIVVSWMVASSYINFLPKKFFLEGSFVMSKNNPGYYAVMGVNRNPVYLFPLLVTVRAWRRLGVHTVLCAAGSEESYTNDPSSAFVLDNLRAFGGVRVIFLETTQAPTHTIAHTCRLFVAASPDLFFNDTDILLTSDSDLWPLHLENHIPTGSQQIFIYNAFCCDLQVHPKRPADGRTAHYPMSTIAMKATLWRTVIGVPKGWLKNGDLLANFLRDEFGVEVISNGTFYSASWGVDQVLVSHRIQQYLKDKNESLIVGKMRLLEKERIDRIKWPKNFTGMDLSRHHDVHVFRPLHTISNWAATLPLIELMFGNEAATELNEYRNRFDELNSARNSSSV